jgi:hypothetical protein
MTAHFKLNEEQNTFLSAPEGAVLLFAGASGTEAWVERAADAVVRIGIRAVAVATAEGGSLEVCIQVGENAARGRDGPAPIEYRLSASQSVDVLVRGGDRVSFKAFPTVENAQILRTVVWTSDLKQPVTPKLDRVDGEAAAPPRMATAQRTV